MAVSHRKGERAIYVTGSREQQLAAALQGVPSKKIESSKHDLSVPLYATVGRSVGRENGALSRRKPRGRCAATIGAL